MITNKDKDTLIREALESCKVAKDRGMQWLVFDQAKVVGKAPRMEGRNN